MSLPAPASAKRVQHAWTFFDWANSVYSLLITTAIFPGYYSYVTQEAFGGSEVQFFGFAIENTVLYSYAISFSFLVIVLLSPVLSGIADYTGKKKLFMQLFTYLGSAACIGLYFFVGENIYWGIACSVLASIGFAGSQVFYNAFLPEIAPPQEHDRLSAKGFSQGYIGSVLLLVLTIIMLTFWEEVGFSSSTQVLQISFLLVGVWWAGFAQYPFKYLQDKATGNQLGAGVVAKGFGELKEAFDKVRQQLVMRRFLLAFFLYSMGVLTIIYLASLFADKELKMEQTELITVILILQLLAIGGAFLFAKVSELKGNRFSLVTMLLIWMVVCVGAYLLQTKLQFYFLAALVGLVMGGIQSLSRSTYSKLIPPEETETASYFSLYDVAEKLAIVIGTFSYGFVEQLTGGMRNSVLFMVLFFAAGLLVLLKTPIPKVKDI